MNQYPQAQINLVEQVAYNLCKANNTITTLEIKTTLRKPPYNDYPWAQHVVSEIMIGLQQAGKFDFKDQGTYRIYSIAGSIPKTAQTSTFKAIKKAKVKRTRSSAITDTLTASQLISQSKGKFLTVRLKTGKILNCIFGQDNGDSISVKQLKDGRNHVFAKNNINGLSLNYTDYQIQ
jgi:hypothetical protein